MTQISSITKPSSVSSLDSPPSLPQHQVSKFTKTIVILGTVIALIALAHAHHPGVTSNPEARVTRHYNAQVVNKRAYSVQWGVESPLNLKLENAAGEVSTLSQYRGQVILLNFWASWCETCQQEIPDFEALAREMKAEKRPFKIVTLSSDEKWSDLNAAMIRALTPEFGSQALSSTQIDLYRDPTGIPQPNQTPQSSRESFKQHRLYGTEKFPESYIIDKKGRIRLRFINNIPLRERPGQKSGWNTELVSYLKWLAQE